MYATTQQTGVSADRIMGQMHLEQTGFMHASAVWKDRYCVCVSIVSGTVIETDGYTMCVAESMWLSIPSTGKALTEGFSRARPAVCVCVCVWGGGVCVGVWV